MIVSIDTSCDETSVAVTDGRRILSSQIYSQILIHKQWGGVVPHLAKRAHEERIDMVVEEALKAITGPFSLDYIAVTQGPGLAPALEVGIRKAKELAKKYKKKIVPVNHMEGHIYSCFAQNGAGNPSRPFEFPYLALLISGGHTELVKFTNHIEYEVIGSTVDDAVGEALDKAGKMLGLGYPGGPVIERLAQEGDPLYHPFTIPMKGSGDLNFSYSGLKTSLLYFLKNLSDREKIKHLKDIAASFQEAAFAHLIDKLDKAMIRTKITRILVAGGVVANGQLRARVRQLVKKHGGSVLFPSFKTLYGDNAAMIGVAAHYKAQKEMFVKDINAFDRVPRARLDLTE